MSTTRYSKSNFWSSLLPRGIAFKKFMKSNKPDETVFKQLFDSIPFIKDSTDTAKETEAGHIKLATNAEVKARTASWTDGHARTVQPHQMPNNTFELITDTDHLCTITEYGFLITTSDTNRTFTLPSLTSNEGLIYTFKKIDSGTGNVIITASGLDQIDGQTTFTLNKQYDVVTIQAENGMWRILNNFTTINTNFLFIVVKTFTELEQAFIILNQITTTGGGGGGIVLRPNAGHLRTNAIDIPAGTYSWNHDGITIYGNGAGLNFLTGANVTVASQGCVYNDVIFYGQTDSTSTSQTIFSFLGTAGTTKYTFNNCTWYYCVGTTNTNPILIIPNTANTGYHINMINNEIIGIGIYTYTFKIQQGAGGSGAASSYNVQLKAFNIYSHNNTSLIEIIGSDKNYMYQNLYTNGSAYFITLLTFYKTTTVGSGTIEYQIASSSPQLTDYIVILDMATSPPVLKKVLLSDLKTLITTP